EPAEKMGANSLGDTAGMALSTAAIVADVPDVESITPQVATVTPKFDIENRIQQAIGLVRSDTAVKGMTGVGTTGTDGAIDRITYEILQAMEERPTLVVWFFDQSGSLQRRREEIRDRFERIYKELGIIREAKAEKEKSKLADEPLLTSIFAFGDRVTQLTDKPTADMDEIRNVIDSVQMDQTGNEKIFSAFYLAVEKYKSYRSSRPTHGPERNVIFIAVTDERGDDVDGLEATIKECRKFAIPVYVIGVPAPFGREFTYIKYVDPDPKFDQTPQWAQVDQGPESLMPERVKLGYRDNFYEEPVMDSGFGPYALSRLAYETGGIYFTVHPNRKFNSRVSRNEIDPFASELSYFFDPEIMAKYRPDYVSQEDYVKQAKESPLRQILIQASRLAAVETLQAPRLRFVRRDEPSLVNELTLAQQAAARLDPQLSNLGQVLLQGQAVRDRETSPRWLAGYDLAVGTVLAHKVRAETYNSMLAKAKRGMSFQDPKNNTWVLQPADEVSVGSKLEKESQTARDILTQVSQQHAGTPWAILANRELKNPIGWKWVEEFTDLAPPRPQARPNNNPPPPPTAAQDEQARMLKAPPPKRPIPKL
ncbi:MAG: VWA domain-containing protein, partial [Pirellulaceae bacterium]|nr:VWA domain-containing protein [Pirellulaceae bacterium]